MGARCFWDENTDAYAQEVFMNVRHTLGIVFARVLGTKAVSVNLVSQTLPERD
jgi:hypothetical protein